MSHVQQQSAKDNGVVSILYPMLTPSELHVWLIKIEAILDAQGVWEAVEPAKGAQVDAKKDKMGHYASKCHRKSRDDEAYPTCDTNEEPALMMTTSQEGTHTRCVREDVVLLSEERLLPKIYHNYKNKGSGDVWYLDNGANNHMTGHREKFQELDDGVTGKVRFYDGSTIQIMGKGTFVFECKNGDQKALQEEYYISKLFSNIINGCGCMYWQQKGDSFQAFKNFKSLMENKTEYKIGTLRTDRGGEFLSMKFTQFCETKGIERYLTAPHSPQKNGVVERRNHTVMAMMRSLLKSTHVPVRFWGEAVRHAVYLLNRLPTKVLRDRTPFEAWMGSKLHLTYLRVFGCVAYVKEHNPYLKKLNYRSSPMVYLGVDEGCKAHRLYDPSRNKLQVSRDVIFQENLEANVETNRETGAQNVTPPAAAKIPTGGETSLSTNSPNTHEATSPQVTNTTVRLKSIIDIYANTEEVVGVEEEENEVIVVVSEKPTCYQEAATEAHWYEAMENEIKYIEKNTWSLTELPSGHKPISLKWVFKLKKDLVGKIVRHKARLMTKGYVQTQGIDFEEVFSPVTRLDTI
ncbi:hypothetical protein GQ457_09G011180 [Hibiscus cannabinus]